MYRKSVTLLLVAMALALGIAPAAAQDDPTGVVDSFYGWYLDYAGYDETTEEFRNPLADGSYQEREELSADLIDRVVAIREEQGGFFHDPFLCAQDVPESFEIVQVDPLTERDAAVLVREYFGFNPHPKVFVVSVHAQDGAWQIADVICQESVTPRGVTETFYNWYLEQVPGGDALDESYPFLTTDLNARIQAARSQREPGGGDPVLCAQDIPNYVSVNPVMVGQDTATMLLREMYAGNPTPRMVTIRLVHDQQWMIDDIVCEIAPETIAELLYNEYITFMRYDMERGIERTPIADWSIWPWAEHMSEDLLASLLDTYRSDEFRPADPFLCAQDLPSWVSAAPIYGPESDSVTVEVSGAYPSGADSFASTLLARLKMATSADGTWMLVDITCAR